MDLAEELTELINSDKVMAGSDKKALSDRIALGKLTRAENPTDHLGTFFVPYASADQQVFLVNHKKSGKWIPPGEHIEPGELTWQAVERGMKEELGLEFVLSGKTGRRILLTAMSLNNPGYPCRNHCDIWYFIDFSKIMEFAIDPREFYTAGWFNLEIARPLIMVDNVMARALEIANRELLHFD